MVNIWLKEFAKKSQPSISETAYVKSLPADENSLVELKKEQADAKKKLGEIDRVLKREKPNLLTARKSLENFQSSLELIGIDFSNLSLNEPMQADTGRLNLKLVEKYDKGVYDLQIKNSDRYGFKYRPITPGTIISTAR